jgi:peptidyl-prolyl cis-trans isomerase A (cyclophilin A)
MKLNLGKFTFGLTLAATMLACAAMPTLAQQSTQSAPPATPAPALPDAPVATAVFPNGPIVVMDTSMGRITCQFFQKQAPNAVANFIGLAEGTKDWTDPATNKTMHHKRYFDGTTFHRVIPEFMIQGGDPTGTGMGNPGYAFDDEFDPNLNFDVPGRLAMANSGPNTNASQFFITEQAYDSLNQHYTIFGQCDDSSIAVVKTIARVERDGNDKPLTPVVLEKVTIVRVVDISADVAKGMLIQKTEPIYPPVARAARVAGTVVLKATISDTGNVENLQVVSGPPMLQQAALDAVKEWRYRPYLLNGQPVKVLTVINVIFTLGP